MNEYTVLLTWDEEAKVWIAENGVMHLILNDSSLDTLIRRVQTAAPEMLELNGKNAENFRLLFTMEAQAVAA